MVVATLGIAAFGLGLYLLYLCLRDTWDGIVAIGLFIVLFLAAGGAFERTIEVALGTAGLLPVDLRGEFALIGTVIAAFAMLLPACGVVLALRWVTAWRKRQAG